MFFGLPGATAICSLLCANVCGASTRFASCSFFMFLVSADANTSAGAPCWICCTSACEPAKLYVRSRSGAAVDNVCFRSLNDSVSDAAAKTLSLPLSFAFAVAVAVVVGTALELSSSSPPHAVAKTASATTTVVASRRFIVAVRLVAGLQRTQEPFDRERLLASPRREHTVEAVDGARSLDRSEHRSQ